jgi:hypothetical protein
MHATRTVGLAVLLTALLLVGSASASARTPARCTVPKLSGVTLKVARHRLAHADCRVGTIHRPKTASANEIVSWQSPKAGRKIRSGSKVAIWLKAKAATPLPTLTTPTVTTTTPTPTPTTPTTPTTPPVVRASIDPSFTQDASDNLKVTWTYSAGATGSALPDGVLAFTVTPAGGTLGPVGGCTINVGAVTNGGTCTIELQNYGDYQTTVTYTGSGAAIAPSTSTETDSIEPLPVTNTYQWGTDAPTAGAYVHTILEGNQARVTVGDPNFEGATSINLTDSAGGQCTALVSGITATCTLTDSATPTSYTLSYPGGTTTTTTVATAHNGQQSVTDQWPSTVVEIDHPQVTTQQVSLIECGGEAPSAGWGNSMNFGCSSENSPRPWPSTITTPAGASGNDAVFLDAWAYGSLPDDTNPAGTVNYNVSPGVEGTDWTVDNTMCGPQCGFEELSFLTPGTYTVSTTFTSADSNYVDQQSGPSLGVTVVP